MIVGLPRHARKDLLDDVLGPVIGSPARQKSQQGRTLGPIQRAQQVSRAFDPIMIRRQRVSFVQWQARGA